MLTSTHASLASRSERHILISKSMRRSWHILVTLRIGTGSRRLGGACAAGAVATGAGGLSGDAEAAVSAAARRPVCPVWKPVRSSRARARSRTAVTHRRRGRGAHRRSRLHARRGARALWPPAWASGQRPPWSQHMHSTQGALSSTSETIVTNFLAKRCSDDPNQSVPFMPPRPKKAGSKPGQNLHLGSKNRAHNEFNRIH